MYLFSLVLAFTLADTTHDIRHAYLRLLSETALRSSATRVGAQAKRVSTAVSQDVGNVAVVQDDGTLITPINLFDLANRSLVFTPATGGYSVSNVAPTFDASAGQKLTLADDDSRSVALGFAFPFYGQSYTSIFLNSDGNLTFLAGDTSITPRDLGRLLAGQPRIAPFFQDLNPSEGGTVTVNVQPSRATFTWTAVPLCCIASQPSPVAAQTFQAVLYADGRVQFNYGAVQSHAAIVGISPGGSGIQAASDTPVDFSTQAAGSAATPNAIAEVFSASAGLCLTCFGQRFYANHEDAYDQIIMFSSFGYPLSGTTAFSESNPIHNEVTGIGGLDNSTVVFNGSSLVGSRGRIQSIVEMGALVDFPSDPAQRIPAVGENTGLSVVSHEIGHRWLAYALYPYNGSPQSDILLGRDDQHWSFFFNTLASFMEGNQWSDNGDGTFRTVKTVSQYSPLDRYVMGLATPDTVPDSFVITNPSGFYNTSSAPATGVNVSGTRTPVTMSQFLQANGPRLPPSAMSPKTFNFAFVLLTANGASPSAADVAKVDTYRTQLESYWNTATGGLATIHTTLVKAAQILPLPLAAGSVTTTVSATLHLQSAAATGGATFQLLSSNAAVVAVPASVAIAAGATDASFKMTMGLEGVATITATSPGYEIIASAAASTNGAAVNGASFAAGYPVAAGSIASFFGPLLTASTGPASTLPLPTSLGGVSITVNGVAAPLFYASPGQINFQVPFATYGSYATLVVTRAVQPPLSVPLLLTDAAPGLFPAVTDALTFAPVTVAHPGEILSLYATGLGPVNPTVASGAAAGGGASLSSVVPPTTATIAGVTAPVLFAGLAPGFVGLYQVNVQVPTGVAGTALPLVIGVLGTSSNTLPLTVQ